MSPTQPFYGSHYHLLQYLGDHRQVLSKKVEQTLGVSGLQWLDCPPINGSNRVNCEWKGIDFLPKDSYMSAAWAKFWPQSGNVQNWDAVGSVDVNGQKKWILVEAKAHVGEIQSRCGAKSKGGLSQIQQAFAETKTGLSIPSANNWLEPYYQYCNRLATLYFLHREHIPTHLVFLYFWGDSHPGKTCPPDIETWHPHLEVMDQHVGLNEGNSWSRWVSKVFLPAWSDQISKQPV